MRRRASNFVRWGYGDEVTFNESWQRQVIDDHILWKSYGCPHDIARLPRAIREAHIAILEGQHRRAEDDLNER